VAVIRLNSLEDLKKILQVVIYGSRRAYICVTDEVAQVWLVPKVTSRHRHYYYLETTEKEVKEALKEIAKYDIPIIHGSVGRLETA